MNTIEIIDLLCGVVSRQAEIIRTQAFFIEEQAAVDEAVKNIFAEQRMTVEADIGKLERDLGPITGAPLRKGGNDG